MVLPTNLDELLYICHWDPQADSFKQFVIRNSLAAAARQAEMENNAPTSQPQRRIFGREEQLAHAKRCGGDETGSGKSLRSGYTLRR